MAKKRIKSPFRPFEGKKADEPHVRLTRSMVLSEAYISLSYSAVKLYTFLRMYSLGNEEVEYAWSLAKKIFGSSGTFNSAKKDLIEKGFIKCIRTSKCSRLPNLYKFSSDWQTYKKIT